jgi:hypothetical protein
MSKLLDQIDAFLYKYPMSPSKFGMLSCKNPHILTRLRNGGDASTAMVLKIKLFMDDFKKS